MHHYNCARPGVEHGYGPRELVEDVEADEAAAINGAFLYGAHRVALRPGSKRMRRARGPVRLRTAQLCAS